MSVLEGQKLVVATHNQGKAKEIAKLLGPYIDEFVTAADLGLDDVEETGSTFVDNAVLKAKAAASASGCLSLADDSGLAVNALGGDPGIYSARWAEDENGIRDFDMAMRKVHDALEGKQDRSAAFICVLALACPDGKLLTFEGRVEGRISWPPRGDKGFGYDPIFVPDGHSRSFAEFSPEEKQAISHRSRAFQKLVTDYFEKEA